MISPSICLSFSSLNFLLYLKRDQYINLLNLSENVTDIASCRAVFYLPQVFQIYIIKHDYNKNLK